MVATFFWNSVMFINFRKVINILKSHAQSAGAVEYTDSTSAEG